jgi:DNA segregation ATPase FtsK/SpoIIIE, S-DNA-T family
MIKLPKGIPFLNRIISRLTNVYGVLIITVVSVISMFQYYMGSESILGSLGDTIANLYNNFLGITSLIVIGWMITHCLKKYFSFKLVVPTFSNIALITVCASVVLTSFSLGGVVGQTIYGFSSGFLGGLITTTLFSCFTVYFLDHAYKLKFTEGLLQRYGVKRKSKEKSIKAKSKVPSQGTVSASQPAAEQTEETPEIVRVSVNASFHSANGMLKRGALSSEGLPDLACLESQSEDSDLNEEDLSSSVESAFAGFEVNTKVVSRKVGPMVVTYFIDIDDGVKLSKIKSILPDVAVKMGFSEGVLRLNPTGASSYGALGIEVPRASRPHITLGDMMPYVASNCSDMSIPICVGVSSLGERIVRDLASFPHIMLAGSTGSGKSVALNNLIVSILGLRLPSQAQLVLIDPKAVEFSVYQGLPNLLTEVVSETPDAIDCLNLLCEIMDSRYKILKENNVRNIQEYQSLSQRGKLKMPFIIVVIDELGDLIMEGGKSVENSVGRLAQKARAAGIHLILATQRPTADIIKGLIKTNVSGRLAFRVSSRVDSEVILGERGAETLSGKGDSLLSEVESTDLIRIQAPYVSMGEIKAVCDQLR